MQCQKNNTYFKTLHITATDCWRHTIDCTYTVVVECYVLCTLSMGVKWHIHKIRFHMIWCTWDMNRVICLIQMERTWGEMTFSQHKLSHAIVSWPNVAVFMSSYRIQKNHTNIRIVFQPKSFGRLGTVLAYFLRLKPRQRFLRLNII